MSAPCLCEFIWVLLRVYNIESGEVINATRALMASENVEMNRPAAEVGLAVLNAGGDFADGVIALEGNWLGGETFVSFDNQAVSLLRAQGKQARLL